MNYCNQLYWPNPINVHFLFMTVQCKWVGALLHTVTQGSRLLPPSGSPSLRALELSIWWPALG